MREEQEWEVERQKQWEWGERKKTGGTAAWQNEDLFLTHLSPFLLKNLSSCFLSSLFLSLTLTLKHTVTNKECVNMHYPWAPPEFVFSVGPHTQAHTCFLHNSYVRSWQTKNSAYILSAQTPETLTSLCDGHLWRQHVYKRRSGKKQFQFIWQCECDKFLFLSIDCIYSSLLWCSAFLPLGHICKTQLK